MSRKRGFEPHWFGGGRIANHGVIHFHGPPSMPSSNHPAPAASTHVDSQPVTSGLADDPLWHKDAIIYELHIRAFFDSNEDGIGDLAGLVEKLDYLCDLGVTAIWLLPFYPSPLRDGGYDIAEYTSVHESYGTRRDF